MKNDKEGFSARGGQAFRKKYGKKGFKDISSKRWDRHHGRICLNCDKTREEIEKKNPPCERVVKKVITIFEVKKFKKHEFNDPTKGRPKPRKEEK